MFKVVKKQGKYSKVAVDGPQEITEALMEIIPQALLFYNLVWLAEPKLKKGLLVLDPRTVIGQVDTTHHGILIHRGTLAYAAETPGLHYADETNAPKVGDWVVLGKHAGQRRGILVDPDMPDGYSEPMNLIHLATVTDTDIQEKGSWDQVRRIRGWL